jgi:hypothetical protein
MSKHVNEYFGYGLYDTTARLISIGVFISIPILINAPLWYFVIAFFALMISEPAISRILDHWRKQHNRPIRGK